MAWLLLSYSPLAAVEPSASPVLSLVVPAYFYPEKNGLVAWNRLITASSHSRIAAIVNPASGPGDQPDENYVKLMDLIGKSRLVPIGYVDTAYSKCPLQVVEAEVDKWIRFYPGIRGILFDEQASDAEHASYYAVLYKYVRQTCGLDLVVNNPGTTCSENYFSQRTSDVVCLHEDHGALPNDLFPAWTANFPATDVLILPYQVHSVQEMQTWIQLAREKKFHDIYVTDASGNNPWDRLPSYWDEEVEAVERANDSAGK